MAKPKYTVVITACGKYVIKSMKDVGFLKPKGTSYVRATRMKQELEND